MAWAAVRDRDDPSTVLGWLPLPPAVEQLWPGASVRYVAHHREPNPQKWFGFHTVYQVVALALICFVRIDAAGAPAAIGLALEATREDLATLRHVPTFREALIARH